MKKLNFLAVLSMLFVTIGLLSSCQKDEINSSENLNGVLKNAVIYDCEQCVETWADTRVTFDATHFVPQGLSGGSQYPTNLYLDIYNDETTIYFRLYRLNGATIGYLQIGENGTPMTFDPAVTEYSWSQPLPTDWNACDKINLFLIVGGVGQYVGHANFCEDYYFRDICEVPECTEETAWAAGTRYVQKGNWATYTPYVANTTVNIYAGQNMLAGTAHFSAVVDGQVTIHIELLEGWMFSDVQSSLKIMTYNSTPPAVNPAPGQFTYKYDATGSSYSVTVPYAPIYGIHLDLMHCELEY